PKDDAASIVRQIYGESFDPNKDAKFEPGRGWVKITIPARELPAFPGRINVNPALQEAWNTAARWQPTPANGPRVWKDVTGDFTAVVRVSFPIRPLERNKLFQPSVAGLVAWAGDAHHAGMMWCEDRSPESIREAFQLMVTSPRGVRGPWDWE